MKFAYSQSARETIEKLLTEFTSGSQAKRAPLLPIYRLELEEELPRIIPIVGNFPVTSKEVEEVRYITSEEPFRMIEVSEKVKLIPVPGWQVILKASDPVGIFIKSDQLSQQIAGNSETVLAVIDRQNKQWDVNSYFLVESQGLLEIKWFPQMPDVSILGQLVLVLRPKKIIDENIITQPWQMDD